MQVNKMNNSYQDYTRQLMIKDAKKVQEKGQSVIEDQRRMEQKRMEKVQNNSQKSKNRIDIYA